MDAFFSAIAPRLVPGYARLGPDGRRRFAAIIDAALAERPAATRLQLSAFLFLLRWRSLLLHGRPLDRLPAELQDAELCHFEDSKVALFRKGFWGVRTLVFMGYYGRAEAWDEWSYRPSRAGNERLHD
ncbi:MAG: hypothetical protein HY078_08900 [Elusimicrobia bacterium]|nr:hypothetical protein [Elusimicrobiota bacterium]